MEINRIEVIKWALFGLSLLLVIFLFYKLFDTVRGWFGGGDTSSPSTSGLGSIFSAPDKSEVVKQLPDKTIPPKSQDVENGGDFTTDVRPGFKPATYSIRLDRVLMLNVLTSDLSYSERCETLTEVNELTDGELALVYNSYKRKYDRLLTDDLKNLTTSGCWLWNVQGLITRLKALPS